MNKKLLVVAAMAMGVFGSTSSFANEVHFKGTVADTPCQISVNDDGSVVDLGEASLNYVMTAGNMTDKIPFNVTLKGCSTETYANAEFAFAGTADADDDSVLSNSQGAGYATGVGIGIVNAAGTLVKLDGTSNTSLALEDGDNTAVFRAYMVGTNGAATVGTVDAKATITVAYN